MSLLCADRLGVGYSGYLASECQRLSLEYFDSSSDFEATVDLAVEYLVNAMESRIDDPGPAVRQGVRC